MFLEIVHGDITQLPIDVIVNAANSSLLGGGGVDGAIHRAAGPELLEECRTIRRKQGGCEVGEAVMTGSGALPCKRVIHTVGPVYNQGGQDKERLLAACYSNSIQLLLKGGYEKIAFPNISTGIYRFPKELAATIAVETVLQFKNERALKKVVFVCFELENYQLYTNLINQQTNESRNKKN
ncbi:O-acetyl-ADP-ribose deacetylase [bacterium SCSIO 12741]|nr:O-acetyl-ADP-ribose deacetylase [bacterium SCSIO 12741]